MNPQSEQTKKLNQDQPNRENQSEKVEVENHQESKKEENVNLSQIKIKFQFKTLWFYLGPGLLLAAGYLDPGNIAADITAGVETGNQLNWAIALALVMCYFYQAVALRIGAVTGQDMATIIAENVENQFTVLLIALLLSIALFAVDMLQLLGAGIGFQIIFGVPLWVGIIITFMSIALIWVVQQYEEAKGIEIIFAILMLILAISFFIVLGFSDPDWLDMLFGTVWPHVPDHKAGQLGILSLFGATLIPHALFMQSGMVKEKKVDPKDKYKLKEIIYYSYIQTAISIFFCLVVNVAVIATFSHWSDSKQVQEGMKVDLYTASNFFQRDLGTFSRLLYGIGIVSAGLSNMIPITISLQFYMQGFLKTKITKMDAVLLIRMIDIVPTLLVCRIFQEDIILDELNIFQIVMVPIALIPLLKIARSERMMGPNRLQNFEYYFLSGLGIFLIVVNSITLIPSQEQLVWGPDDFFIFLFVGFIYIAVIVWLIFTNYGGDVETCCLTEKQQAQSPSNLEQRAPDAQNGDQTGELLPVAN